MDDKPRSMPGSPMPSEPARSALMMSPIGNGSSLQHSLTHSELSASAAPASGSVSPKRSHKSKSSKHLNFEKELESNPVVFVSPPPDILLCPIHKDLIQQAVIARCGHTFCRSCIEKHLAQQPSCPVDGTPLQAAPEYLFPNLAVAGQIENLVIYCKYGLKKRKKKGWEPDDGGCQEHLKLGQRAKHEDQCGFAIVKCPSCDALPMRRRQLNEHAKGCSRIHCVHHEAGCPFVGSKASRIPLPLFVCCLRKSFSYRCRMKQPRISRRVPTSPSRSISAGR